MWLSSTWLKVLNKPESDSLSIYCFNETLPGIANMKSIGRQKKTECVHISCYLLEEEKNKPIMIAGNMAYARANQR